MDKEQLIELRNSIVNLSKEEKEQHFLYLQELAKGIKEGPNTGIPSIDMPWLKHIRPESFEYVLNAPKNKTVWDVVEEKLYEYYDYPAIEYFGKLISRQDFIDLCYTWARTFRAMGVEENEIVPVYGPFVPDICAMTFGLNMIGATPYFLKLAISPEALAEETREAKIAVVYDGMWKNVASEFSKDRFKKIIVATVTADMPRPKKEIVSFLSAIEAKKTKSQIPNEKKYIWADKTKEIADYYTGEVKVPFVPYRSTFITSSSGTTIDGVVKGTTATNESAIFQLYTSDATDVQFFPGDRCLNHFPPTASTSLNTLFLLPLYRGMTVLIDPRVSEKDFYNQITRLKPNVSINTGSMWEAFFNRIEKEMSMGKIFDFSHAKVWVVGGEGTDVNKMIKWNGIMKKCNNERGMVSGYGASEVFASACTEKIDARAPFDKPIVGVGVPYAGLIVGVFDEKGNELSYNQRGNLWINGPALMKGYYGKPELTNKVIENNWFKTGDVSEIDNEGFVYIWGRENDKIKLDNGETLYLFDVANKIKENEFIDDAIVTSLPTKSNKNNLVAHIVWKDINSKEEKIEKLNIINKSLKEFLPQGVEVSGYYEYEKMLPYSPTTLKKDKNRMASQKEGFIQVIDDELKNIDFIKDETDNYTICITKKEDNKVKVKKRLV